MITVGMRFLYSSPKNIFHKWCEAIDYESWNAIMTDVTKSKVSTEIN